MLSIHPNELKILEALVISKKGEHYKIQQKRSWLFGRLKAFVQKPVVTKIFIMFMHSVHDKKHNKEMYGKLITIQFDGMASKYV